METGLADSLNTNTKNSQMKHFPYLGYAMIYGFTESTCKIYRP